MEENNKSKKFMLFGLIALVITIAVSSTYAYYVWSTSDNEVTKIVAGVGSAIVTFDGGSDINASLRPVSDKSKGIVKEIKVKTDTTGLAFGLTFNMYLDITSIATELKDVSFRYEFYKGSTKLKEGNFSDTYLNSNTTDCSTNSTKHITLLANESISTSNTNYTLYIWIDGANYVNPSTMMGKEFNFKLHADGEGAVVKRVLGNAATYISSLYTGSSKTTVTNNKITYNTAESVSLMNDRLGGTTTDLDGGNIRYYGANPNNYIYFNCSDYNKQTSTTCETWRIIGVFDGKLKIMRGSQIGAYAWDNKNTSTGADDRGKNDWTTARLMKLLNSSNYYTTDSNDNGLGQSLYWNSASGKCYSGVNNATTKCDFTSTGIKNDVTKNLISEETWNIGGWNSSSIYSNQIYGYERGTTVYSGRPTTWTGKIALAYPSDYGYAADLSQCTKQLGSYSDSTCTSNNWMKTIITNNGGNIGWLLIPYSSYNYNAWYVASSGYTDFYFYYTYGAYGVTPVLYLTSDLAIESGDGSSTNPYQLSV